MERRWSLLTFDKTLKVWDGESGTERFTLSGHVDWVTGCAVSANGTTIVSASGDGTLKVWDGRRGAERFTLSGHIGWRKSLRGERGWSYDSIRFVWKEAEGVGWVERGSALHAKWPCGWGDRLRGEREWNDNRLGFRMTRR